MYQKGLPLTLAVKIFSVKVLRFTFQHYKTVNLIRTSNIAHKDQCHQEEGRTVPETSYDGAILVSAEM